MNEYAVIGFGAVTGIALSSAVGFRVFLPFLVAAIATKLGVLGVAQDFAWLGSWPAIAVLAAASLSEILAYYIPVLDHALDVIGAPAAVVAGTLLTASMVVGMDEWLRWSLALIAGGGVAGTLHTGFAALRGASTATTAAIANPVIATGEVVGATTTAVAAIALPVVVAGLAVVAVVILLTWLTRSLLRRTARGSA
ncbi:MAG: hypothetical protein RLZZ297_1267 [Chloroflexota bacterium]|jgi:hypothetical protein